MRNKLLAAMALCCATSMSVWAGDWGKPTVKTVDPDLTIPSDPIPTTGFTYLAVKDYYIYHEATGMFLCAGNAYGTQLSVGTIPEVVRLSYGYDRLLYNAESYAHKGWLLIMPNAKSNSAEEHIYHEVFIGSGSAAYVDGTNGHMLWQILRQENGAYRLKAIDEDPEYGSASEWADGFMARVPQNETDKTTIVQPAVLPNVAGMELAEYDWGFVTMDDYKIYLAKIDLCDLLDQAEAGGLTALDAYVKVYSDENATLEQVEKAIEELDAAYLEHVLALATPENPVDVTSIFLKDADNVNIANWKVTVNSGNGKLETKSNEHWSGTVVSYLDSEFWNESSWSCTGERTLTLPNGTYRLTATGRANTNATVSIMLNERKISFPSDNNTGGTIDVTGKEWASVEEGTAAGATFANGGKGFGWNYASVTLQVTEGTLVMAVEMVGNAQYSWASCGNFKLEYLGGLSREGVIEDLKAAIDDAETQAKGYESSNSLWSLAGWEAYEKDVQDAKDAVADNSKTDKELSAMITILSDRMDSLARDVEVYTTLMPEKLKELDDMWNRTEQELELKELGAYVDSLNDVYNARTFNPNDYDGITAKAEAIYAQCLRDALLNGEIDDASVFATNLDFSKGTTGWQGGPAVNYGVAESYQKAFDIYQVVEGLPMGTYVVTVQGFYRPGLPADCATHYGAEGDEFNEVRAYLYGNDSQVQLKHAFTEGLYDESVENKNWSQLTAPNAPEIDGKYVANSMETASMAFADGHYKGNTVTCSVAQDGKLRIGIRLVSSPNSGYWTLFDNFTITYKGESLEGFRISLESTIAAAKDAAETNEVNGLAQMAAAIEMAMDNYKTMEEYQTAIEKLNTAIETAQAVAAANKVANGEDIAVTEDLNALKSLISTTNNELSGYTVEQLEAATKGLKEAVEVVNKGITLIKEIYTAAGLFQTQVDEGAFNEYDQKDIDKFVDAVDGVMIAYEELGFETYAEVEEYRDAMYQAYTAMTVGTNVTGSAEEPADLTKALMSPSFVDFKNQASSIGWNYVKDGGNANLVAADKLFEMYDNNSFDMYQVVYGLPAGWYTLEMQGFYRAGSSAAAMGARRDSTDARNAYLYATTSDGKTIKNALPSIFEGVVVGVGSTPGRNGSDVVISTEYRIEGDVDYMYIPNNTAGSNARFELGLCKKELIFEVPAGCEYVRLGVKKDVHIGADWAIFDNFTLKYTGSDKPDAIETVAAESAAEVVSTAYYTIGGVRVAQPTVRGLYIRVDALSDGSSKVTKILVK